MLGLKVFGLGGEGRSESWNGGLTIVDDLLKVCGDLGHDGGGDGIERQEMFEEIKRSSDSSSRWLILWEVGGNLEMIRVAVLEKKSLLFGPTAKKCDLGTASPARAIEGSTLVRRG